MQTHILNGDALREQFPAIGGELIFARACLVDGPVSGDSLEALYATRARFISENYGGPLEQYAQKTVPEFEKIQSLSPEAEVNLWFEDDLFCQVNMWFVAYLIASFTQVKAVYLVRPTGDMKYGFGGMSKEELSQAYANRKKVSAAELSIFAQLWQHYQAGKLAEMKALAQSDASAFPFLPAAVQAHIDRYPAAGNLGRPERSLLAIMDEVGSEKFGPVFRAFWEREAIYGFGDLQVKRLYDKLVGAN
jgi:hypothetical protein